MRLGQAGNILRTRPVSTVVRGSRVDYRRAAQARAIAIGDGVPAGLALFPKRTLP